MFLYCNNQGGGVYIGVETIFVRILSSLFGENSATSGAAIYIETNNMHITVAQTVFLQNSASESGTVYIGKSNYVTSFLSCQFQYNTATLSGGAIFINVDNLNVNILASTFAMNSAPDGGAVLTKSGNAMLTIYGTSFSSNGGDASSGVGGAINVDTNNANLVIGLTTFTNNIAFTAPALYLGSQNSGKISYSSFNSNSATSGGGAVVLGGSSNVFFFDDSVFEANTAINGGALLVEGGNTVHFDTCQFAFNAASGAGGALWVTDSSTTIANSNFRANEANKFGGALNFENSLASIISISTSLFERNAAISGGGALSIQKYGGFQIQHTKFFQNSVSAGSGSAILIAELSSSAILYCNFTANAASVSGAVQWRHSNRFNEPMNLTSPLNFFSSNTAAYGPNYATQATHISRIDNGETFYSNNFEGDSDQIDVYTLDWYDQVVLSDVHNLARVSVSEPFLCGDAYDFGAVTGGTIVSVVDGLASFRSLQFLCFPAGSMNLNFTATIDGADIEGTYSVQFRSCSRGEYFEGRSCHVCPTGFFSLQNNSDLSVRECLRCPNGAKFCASDIMEVREGYWRMNGDETIPFKCPRDSSSCEGGYSTGASACADGYEGVLCGVCSDGFYLSAASNTCEVCEDSGVNFVSIFFILVGTIVTFAAVVYFVFRWLGVKISLRLFYDEDVQAEVVAKVFNKVHQKFHSKRRLSTIVELENQVHTNPKIASELDDPVSESAHEPVTAPSIGDEESLCHKSPRLTPPMSHYDDPGALGKKDKKKKFIDRISGRIKIYLSLFQILSSFPFILDISYPSSYQTVLSYVGISNFNMPQILGK